MMTMTVTMTRIMMVIKTTMDDVDDDGPVWFYGWRAVAIGCLLMAISAFCFAAALGFVHLDGL